MWAVWCGPIFRADFADIADRCADYPAGPVPLDYQLVERSNLSTRMSVCCFTRLTNALCKKWDNHWAAIAAGLRFTTSAASANRSA